MNWIGFSQEELLQTAICTCAAKTETKLRDETKTSIEKQVKSLTFVRTNEKIARTIVASWAWNF